MTHTFHTFATLLILVGVTSCRSTPDADPPSEPEATAVASSATPEPSAKPEATDDKARCESLQECAELGRCVPAESPDGELSCTATAESCDQVAICREWGCDFDASAEVCRPKACGQLDLALADGAGLDAIFGLVDPDGVKPWPEVLEEASDLLLECDKSPHYIERIPPGVDEERGPESEWPIDLVSLPGDGPVSGTLFRTRCYATEIPCASGFDEDTRAYTAFAWKIGEERGVIPLFDSSTGSMQGDIDLIAAETKIRELGPNAFGWTHELVWTEGFWRSNWGSDENGATCCEYETNHTETLHALIRIDQTDVSLGAVYISKTEHDAYEWYGGGKAATAPAGVDCRASLKWTSDGAAHFTTKLRNPWEVVVRPESDGDGFVLSETRWGDQWERRVPTLDSLQLACYSQRI